jgi:4-hydroxythreonine-4-phosphate dehydrogenase
MSRKNIVAGITHGDINGVGYEVIIKTLMDNRVIEECTPVVYGSPKVAAYHRKALNITNFSFNTIKVPEEAVPRKCHIINCLDEDVRVELGKSTEMAGEGSALALEKAVDDAIEGKIDLLVTAPINKHNVQSGNFPFPGHTEFLKSKCGVEDVLMIMVSENMKIGVVTGHIALRDIPGTITTDLILSKIRIMNRSLMVDFGTRKPRIALLSLNPHAGDEGLLGDEEQNIIIPAINMAAKEEILVFGPYPADGFFGAGSFANFDGILAMYHDQGLAPFKALAFDTGVNFTAGLPFVRTSPNHGTAYDLAGKGEASENSFRQALYLACDILKNREMYSEITSDPLRSQGVDTQSGSEDLPGDDDNGSEGL